MSRVEKLLYSEMIELKERIEKLEYKLDIMQAMFNVYLATDIEDERSDSNANIKTTN